jgi:hypothetical protein
MVLSVFRRRTRMMKPLRNEPTSHFPCPLLAVMILVAAALPACGEPDAGAGKRTNSAGKGASARSRSVSARQVVQAEGIGRTLEEARRDAIHAAVRKAAGMLVVSELTIENDKVITDKVLAYSDGVIAPGTYRELKRTRQGQLWGVRISAQVVSRKLAERLEAAGLATHKVNGEGLAATVLSRAEARARGAELLASVLGELPGVLVARVEAPLARNYDEEKGHLRLIVRVGVDARRYDRWVRRASLVLSKVCTWKGVVVLPPPGQRGSRLGLSWELNRGFRTLTRLNDAEKSWFVWLFTGAGPGLRSTAWQVFRLDCPREQALAALSKPPILEVALLDAQGKRIASQRIELAEGGRRTASGGATTTSWGAEEDSWLWFHRSVSLARVRPRGQGDMEHVVLMPLRYSPSVIGGRFTLVEGVRVLVPLDARRLECLSKVECSVVWE